MYTGAMLIRQGEIYWVELGPEDAGHTGITHPQVVIQDDVINASRVDRVVVCGLSTNMKRAYDPGNVLLDTGEANLPKPSFVVVSQVSSILKSQLGERIGCLGSERIAQIFAGMAFLQSWTENRPARVAP